MYFLLFFASLVAFGLSAVTGGGASLLLVPLLARALPAAAVPAALSIGTGISSLSRIAVFWRHVRWDVTLWFVPAALPLAVLGSLLLKFLNPMYVQVIMALFLLSNLPQLLRPAPAQSARPVSRLDILVVGGLAGFLSGLTGAVGVLFNRFYLNHGLTKQQIVATRGTNEVLIHAAKLVVYANIGLIDGRTASAGAVVAVAAAISSFLLKPLLQRLPHQTFARIGYAAMTLSGAVLLYSSVSKVVRQDRIAVSFHPVVDGGNARIQWRNATLELELEYDGEIEAEFPAHLNQLSPEQRQLVRARDPGADTIAIEAVYGFDGKHYEAYYLQKGEPIKKITFDAAGALMREEE